MASLGSLQGASLCQQVMALLPGGEKPLLQMHHVTPDPTGADAVQQWPLNRAVRPVTPGGRGGVELG